MRILILDHSTQSQAFCAKRIEAFSQSDIETLDLQVDTVSPQDLMNYIDEVDVLVVGSEIGENSIPLIRQAQNAVPWLHVIMFVSDDAYGGQAFKAAHSAGVRKVFPDSASPLDLLQELVAIHAEFKREGRTKEGKVIVVTHAKGGVGATSLVAALAEVCSRFNRRTLAWDLDVETRDLCRALTVSGPEAQIVNCWVNGQYDLTRQSLQEALVPISTDVSVLMPPDQFIESMDLICHTDGAEIVRRIVELARPLFDAIIIDTAGRMSPAIGSLLSIADEILIVLDDTLLGLTAVDIYLTNLKNIIGSSDQIKFLINPYTGAPLTVDQIAADLEPVHKLGPGPWQLPIMPNDPKGAMWAGSGYTLYSMGLKTTSIILEEIAAKLGLVNLPPGHGQMGVGKASSDLSSGWVSRVFKRKSVMASDEITPEAKDDLSGINN